MFRFRGTETAELGDIACLRLTDELTGGTMYIKASTNEFPNPEIEAFVSLYKAYTQIASKWGRTAEGRAGKSLATEIAAESIVADNFISRLGSAAAGLGRPAS